MKIQKDKNFKHLRVILKEMCKRVKCNYSSFNFDKPNWFWGYQWTEPEQDDFRDWLINYMKKHKDAREELMSINSKETYMLERFANWFLLDYGWKLK